MNTQLKLVVKLATLLSVAVILFSGCSGGTEGTGENPPPKSGIHGLIEAPGGAIAFSDPSPWSTLLDLMLGKTANAKIDGVAPVGAGVSVSLIQVDANGDPVGEVLATTETHADGTYDLPINDFQAASHFVVRAVANNQTLDARVTQTTVNINPISDAASQLIAKHVSDLGLLELLEVDEIVGSVNQISKNVDPSGKTARTLSDAMQQEALNDNESGNIISSSTSLGLICGNVTDPSGLPLSQVNIIARDFGNWVTRAVSKTNADGNYCLNVPTSAELDPDTGELYRGEYILGAENHGYDTQHAATQWWNLAGNGDSQFTAEKILVENANRITRNFSLSAGATISGNVSVANLGVPIEGITVIVRQFDSLSPVASAHTDEHGNYRLNISNGSYFVEARNSTIQAYASEVYDGKSGSNNMNYAVPVDLTVGQSRTIHFSLEQGVRLDGTISKGVGGTPVAGRRIMVNAAVGGGAIRLRSNRVGYYNVWLKSDTYHVYAYGQQNPGVVLNTRTTVNFYNDAITTINATVMHNNSPVSQAKIRLYSIDGNYINQEPSSSDGSVSLYTNVTGDHLIETRIDSAANYGSSIYDNKTSLASGLPITIGSADSAISIGTINLPDGGVLRGKVTIDGSNPAPNTKLQILSGVDGQSFIIVRSRGDGSYVVSLPAGTYSRANFANSTGAIVDNCDSVAIISGQTTVLNFNIQNGQCS